MTGLHALATSQWLDSYTGNLEGTHPLNYRAHCGVRKCWVGRCIFIIMVASEFDYLWRNLRKVKNWETSLDQNVMIT